MKQSLLYLLLVGLGFQWVSAQDFASIRLAQVEGDSVSMDDFKDSSAVVLIFSGVHCVYSKKYESRILEMIQSYQGQGIAFLMVNSNDPKVSPEDSFDRMQEHASEKAFSFPYLADPDQALAHAVKAEKNPEAFVFAHDGEAFQQVYAGALDDNPLMATAVRSNYLKMAIDHVLEGKTEALPNQAVKGCYIKHMD